ncbi:MAG: hydrogenase nickel incorporation protein HypB [Clostridia bacterium]|nr:hydrogenase nickel incorporation protein HypB [Clostridia bacterium]
MEIKVMHQIMEWNEDVSDQVKATLAEHRICLINVMGSPGAGKTSLIVKLIAALRDEYRIGVIEGDIAGQIDAETIDKLGIPVVQLDTDGACHIEAESVRHMLPLFDLEQLDVLIVENIGNLVCPAEFNIGEAFRVALLSVPEGDDKVHKYPLMFATSDAVVMHKYDMLPYFDFDDKRVENDAKGVNPQVKVFRASSRTGEGMEELLGYLRARIDAVRTAQAETKEENP